MRRLIALVFSVIIMLTSLTVFAEEKIDSIKVSVSSSIMEIGERQKIVVYVSPVNLNPTFEYESDNSDVVIAAVGTLIAKSEGVANITVRVSGTDIQDTVQITVLDEFIENNDEDKDDNTNTEEEIKVSKITLEDKTIYMERYDTERIEYEVYPDNATNQNVSFKSSNTSIATVDKDGYVYAKREGSVTITIQSEDGNAFATLKVYVSDDEDDYDSTLRNIYITYEDEVVKEKFEVMETTTVQLGVKSSSSSASKKVKWRSSNKRIATVDSNGKVTGVKNGTCTIYATSTVNSSKRDSITVVVTDYVRYPDRITVKPLENSVYETGNQIQFYTLFYPEDTTEIDIIWKVFGGATISQTGLLNITDSGEITVKAYSSNRKIVGEYKFNSIYRENHFATVGTVYNLSEDRDIELYFDKDIKAYSASTNIFAAVDERGNGEKINIDIKTDGSKILVSPVSFWPAGDVYIFIKGELCDTSGNSLGENLKYKMNIRGNVYD